MEEQRYETRRTFLEGQGHLVEQVPFGGPLKAGQRAIPTPPAQPPMKVIITAADVSLEIARQVCESAGMVVVPANFLNPDQLAELNISVAPDAPTTAESTQPAPEDKGHKLNAEQMVERVKQAATFEELNALMADETRKAVINAAEQRAEELKAGGAR